MIAAAPTAERLGEEGEPASRLIALVLEGSDLLAERADRGFEFSAGRGKLLARGAGLSLLNCHRSYADGRQACRRTCV